MWSWRLDPPLASGLILAAAAYLGGAHRIRRAGGSPVPGGRVAAFLAGLAIVAVALQSPIDAYANVRFSVHMVQHLLLTMVAAPLLLIGMPFILALRSTSAATRRRLLLPIVRSRLADLLSQPVFAWTLFMLVMWGSHLSAAYEAALRNDRVHALEHAAYLGSALLFWWPVVGRGPGRTRLSHPGRILFVFAAMAQSTFLGLAIYSSEHVWYPHYLRAWGSTGAALADQHLAGALMWEGEMVLFVLALAGVLLDWMNADEREALRAEARSAAGVVR